MFEVLKRQGLARIGKWHMKEQDSVVNTPNILFLEGIGIKKFNRAEMEISNENKESGVPQIISSPGLFPGGEAEVSPYTVSPSLVYPPSQKELNEFAAKINKDHFSSKIFVVTQKDDEAAESVSGISSEVYVVANALHLIQRSQLFVNTIVTLRKAVGYQSLIYTPGLGNPNHMALLAYLGVDLFDSLPLILNSTMGNYLTAQGKISRDEFQYNQCSCPSCVSGKTHDDHLLLHNYHCAMDELGVVKNAIHRGQLRELLEGRMRSEPWMVSALRLLDTTYYSFCEEHLPVTGTNMIAASWESLTRPEIVRFRNRISTRYNKPPSTKILLLLPCSAKKPYSFSNTHKKFRKAIFESKGKSIIHEVIITSPMGIVPRELELFYPAQQYDIPVTKSWSLDEIAMIQKGLSEFVTKNRYDSMVVHLPSDYGFVTEVLDDFMVTCEGSPTSFSSLEKLTSTLKELARHYERAGDRIRLRENMENFACFQFGKVGSKLVEDAKIVGRYPNLRMFKNKEQVGMLTQKRGLISLTLEGGRILADENTYWVKIDDFQPVGNIFAVGVMEADEKIRVGDDVVVLRGEEVIGVGVAMMSPREMISSNRGEAVRIRHLAKPKGEGR